MAHRFMIGICILQQAGCVQICNRIDECAINIQDKKITNEAWSYHRQSWEAEEHAADFRIGFKAGYLASLDGEECPPAVPPRFYWSAKNSKIDARGRTDAWFRGWWMGSAAATSDGLFDHREVQIAPHLHHNSNTPEVVWPESNSVNEDASNLIPIPDVNSNDPIHPDHGLEGSDLPFVPPAIGPPEDSTQEYNPAPKKKISPPGSL